MRRRNLVNFIIQMMEQELNDSELANKEKITRYSRMLVFRFSEMIAYSIIQKTAIDTSSKELSRTYNTVQCKVGSTSINLIVAISGLEQGINRGAIDNLNEIYNTFKNNSLVKSICQRIALKYLYLNELDFRERQRICSLFNIKYDIGIQKKLSDKLT